MKELITAGRSGEDPCAFDKPIYDFRAAQGYVTDQGVTLSDLRYTLRETALELADAAWDANNRADLILSMQSTALEVLRFLDLIDEKKVTFCE